jgi:type I restriction enzyme M protein
MSISSTIKSIQDIMRKDVGVDGDAQRLSQLVWMLFLKIFDDRESEWELLQDKYKSPLPEKYRWRNWAANAEGMTGDELKQFLDNDLFPALQNLEAKGSDQRAYVIRSVFEDAYNYMKSGQLIRQVINKIQEGVDFNKAQERHLFGDMYEQLLRDLQAAGNAGEFYTPRAVTEFMVQMVNPRLGEKVMDPACGTGGFLSCSIEHIRKQDVKTLEDEAQLQGSIFGIEKKPMPHLLCTTNMILHGIDVPSNIRHDNTLARPLISWGPSERVDVVVTNPPFGGMEEDGIETNFPAAFRTRETADLFLVLIMQILKPGGRAAVVLPDGFLFGEGIKTRIKEKLLEECNLHTIVRLPNSVFSPYTSIKTNLLFFTKGAPTKDIWFYEHSLPLNVKAYNKTKPMKLQEFDVEKAWWGFEKDDFRARVAGSASWKINIEEIKAKNFNLDFKNPHIRGVEARNPEEMLLVYRSLRDDIKNLGEELKSYLKKAFDSSLGLSDMQQFLLEHLDIWIQASEEVRNSKGPATFNSGAVYGISKLRELILDLAVSGRLVDGDSESNAAYQLYLKLTEKKINSTKGRSKNLPELDGSESLPYLAENWVRTRLGEVAEKITDGSHNPPKDNGSGIPMLSSQNVNFGSINFDAPSRYIAPEEYVAENARTKIEAGDLLLTIVGSIGRAAVVPKNAPKFALQRSVAVIKTGLNPDFIRLLLGAPFWMNFYLENGKGTAQKGIYLRQLAMMPIVFPSLREQDQIVLAVNELMELCDKLEIKIKSLNVLRQEIADEIILINLS